MPFWALLLALFSALPAVADGLLVFGGTGRLGSETVAALLKANYRVTVFARPTSDRARLRGLDVDFIVGNLLDEGAVVAAFRRIRPNVVIDASALYDGRHEAAVRNIVAGARAVGVDRVIHHGSVGAGDNMALFPQVDFRRLAAILRDKGRAEAVLIGSGLTYTIIRNGLLENDDGLSSGRARLTEDQSVLGRITRRDLAALTVECAAARRCANKIVHALDDALDASRAPACAAADCSTETVDAARLR